MKEPLIDKLKNTLTDNEWVNLRKLAETLNKPITPMINFASKSMLSKRHSPCRKERSDEIYCDYLHKSKKRLGAGSPAGI